MVENVPHNTIFSRLFRGATPQGDIKGAGTASTRQRGFTLIEMLVVVAIMVIVTGTVLANNAKFGGTVLLQNLAYDIALSTREAQVYGVSVKRFQTNFTAPFGVHFETGANNKTYLIFADALGASNGHYDCPQPNNPSGCESTESTSITRGYEIGSLCVTPNSPGATEDCGHTSLDIVYNHPEPDACISIDGATTYSVVKNVLACSNSYQSARIVVTSPRGDSMNICVDANGQISVHGGQNCVY